MTEPNSRAAIASQPIPRYNLTMSRTAIEILEDVRQLPIDEVDWLIESLLLDEKNETDATVETAWDSEIKRRLNEIDSGAVELLPAEQVHAEIIAGLSPQARKQ
jgi:hypothetical protein